MRVDETRMPAERRHWRVGKRDHEPERQEVNHDKLKRRYDAQVHVGTRPCRSQRRLPIAARARKVLKSKLKLQAKSKRVSKALHTVRAKAEAAG